MLGGVGKQGHLLLMLHAINTRTWTHVTHLTHVTQFTHAICHAHLVGMPHRPAASSAQTSRYQQDRVTQGAHCQGPLC